MNQQQRDYKLNTILWIEDEPMFVDPWTELFGYNKDFVGVYGRDLTIVRSDAMEELPPDQAESEIERLVNEAGDASTIINVATAQLARTILERYIPGAVISDSSFPLNGQQIVGWLKAHGLPSYPLIGLSGNEFCELSPEVQEFFTQTPAVYFSKLGEYMEKLPKAVVFSRDWVELQMGRENLNPLS